MSSVGTQSEANVSVIQVVYEAVFENQEKFRQISEERAAKQRAQEAAREAAAREAAAAKAAAQSPSVIVDVKSADVAAPTPAPTPAPEPTKTVDIFA